MFTPYRMCGLQMSSPVPQATLSLSVVFAVQELCSVTQSYLSSDIGVIPEFLFLRPFLEEHFFRFPSKVGNVRDFAHRPSPRTCLASPTISIPTAVVRLL